MSDNIYDQYMIEDSDNNSSSSSDEEDEMYQSELLTNNRGVLYDSNHHNDILLNQRRASEYDDIRNRYFTPELIKKRILIDSKNVQHTNTHSTSNYTIYFDGDSKSNLTNLTGGFSTYKNVIGFRLIQAMLPNSTYQINENHNQILFKITLSGIEYPLTAIMSVGSFTFQGLASVFENALNTAANAHNITFTVTPNTTTYKYEINWDTTATLLFLWNDSPGHPHRMLGALNINETEYVSSPINLPNVVDHSFHFVDLVIPEIPYVGCKENILGKHIIDRIPLNEPSGMIVSALPYNEINYFQPITLDKLTIQLYEDTSGLLYDSQNADNSFEFEIVMLNRNINL